MRNFSTLIYFINQTEKDLVTHITRKGEEQVEDLLEGMSFEPSDNSVKKIMDFARSYEVLETETAGYVEMNLN